METTLKVLIITPNKKYDVITCKSLSISTDNGEVTILPNHEEYLANVTISLLTILKDEETLHYAVGGGAIHFDASKNTAEIFVGSIKDAKDIDLNKTIEKEKSIEQRLHSDLSNLEHQQAELSLKRAINEINIKNKFNG